MKLETFFEKFDLFADAPDAVAKMRELVLQLGCAGQTCSPGPQRGIGIELDPRRSPGSKKIGSS